MNEPRKIILAIGSNYNAPTNIELAKSKLRSLFPDVTFTQSVWTTPIDMPDNQEPFINCLCVATTRHGLPQIKMSLKRMEHSCGNSKAKRTKSIVVIDIDILQYGDEIMHEDDWKRPYIKKLMKQI